MEIKVKRLDPEAKLPRFALKSDAGMDFFSNKEYSIQPGGVGLVETGIAMEIPEGFVGLIWDKSGIATKNSIKTLAGVVDAGYRGEVKIALINLGKSEYHVEAGAKVAQMLIQKIEEPEIVEVDELSSSVRGSGGFGSTGLISN